MISYHVTTSYQLLCAMVHKTSVHQKDKCAIIVPKTFKKSLSNFDELKSFFNKIVVYDAKAEADGDFKDKSEKYFEEILKKEKLSGSDFEDMSDFELTNELSKLDEEWRNKIKSFFCDEPLEIAEKSTLVITEPLFNLGTFPFDDQALIYQLFIDYFFENKNIVFKPDPEDYLYYGLLFPEASVIRKRFPSELLPFVLTAKPETVASISDKVVAGLKDCSANSFSLGARYEKEFKNTHKYKLAAEFKNTYFNDAALITIGTNENIVSAFVNNTNSATAKKYHIIDNIKTEDGHTRQSIIDLLKNSTDNDAFVFINSGNDYCFYDVENKDIWQNLSPIVIKKQRLRSDDFHENESEEALFLFSKNQDILNLWHNFNYEKTLRHTGVKIFSSPIDESTEKIIKLKALLKATETRLLELEVLKKHSKKKAFAKINEDRILEIRYSDDKISIEDLDDFEKTMRILEGVIKSTERRLIFYANN